MRWYLFQKCYSPSGASTVYFIQYECIIKYLCSNCRSSCNWDASITACLANANVDCADPANEKAPVDVADDRFSTNNYCTCFDAVVPSSTMRAGQGNVTLYGVLRTSLSFLFTVSRTSSTLHSCLGEHPGEPHVTQPLSDFCGDDPKFATWMAIRKS
jgi:hypothetical protein